MATCSVRPSRLSTLRAIALLTLGCVVALLPAAAQAERPATPLLLPDSTVVYVSVPSTPELAKRFMETSAGKMYRQEQMKPLIDQLYGELQKAAKPLEDQLGLTLDEMLAIPQGEITLAMIAQEGKTPAGFGLIDVKDQVIAADRLLEQGITAPKTKRMVGETEVNVIEVNGGPIQEVIYFERDGAIVFCTDAEVLLGILKRWDGERDKTLEGNSRFNTIRSKCKGADGEDPQLVFFADPLAIVDAVAPRDEFTVQFVLTILERLGIRGIQAVGGSVAFATEHFDQVTRLHLMLESPREGIVEMFALRQGDVTPEKWVPADVVSYTTFHWDIKRTFQEISELVDSFQGTDFLKNQLKQGLERAEIDVDVDKDIFDAMANRFSLVTWIQKPVTVDSNCTLFVMHLKDGVKSQETFDKFVARFGENLEKESYAGRTYYRIPIGGGRPPALVEGGSADPGGVEVRLQPIPRPCFALVDDYLMVANQPPVLEEAMKTLRSGGTTLADSEDFQIIMEEIKDIAAENEPSLVSFSRPEEGLRYLYDLADAKDTRERIGQLGETNQFFGAINRVMKDNPLPPFEELTKVLAPAGAVLIDDETGFHYVSFGLKADESKEKGEAAEK